MISHSRLYPFQDRQRLFPCILIFYHRNVDWSDRSNFYALRALTVYLYTRSLSFRPKFTTKQWNAYVRQRETFRRHTTRRGIVTDKGPGHAAHIKPPSSAFTAWKVSAGEFFMIGWIYGAHRAPRAKQDLLSQECGGTAPRFTDCSELFRGVCDLLMWESSHWRVRPGMMDRLLSLFPLGMFLGDRSVLGDGEVSILAVRRFWGQVESLVFTLCKV